MSTLLLDEGSDGGEVAGLHGGDERVAPDPAARAGTASARTRSASSDAHQKNSAVPVLSPNLVIGLSK